MDAAGVDSRSFARRCPHHQRGGNPTAPDYLGADGRPGLTSKVSFVAAIWALAMSHQGMRERIGNAGA